MKTFWHYSSAVRLPIIIDSGTLKCSNAGAPYELPMLWFSADQKWDETATKVVIMKSGLIKALTFRQQLEKFGCIRFGLIENDPRFLPWKEACAVAGTSDASRRQLAKRGHEMGCNPANWYATATGIPLNELHFQILRDRWSDVTNIKDIADVWRRKHKKHVVMRIDPIFE